MIKTKDDKFYGDEITNNVKYYDNEWQAQGTVDRDYSMFTKEPLLNLFFKGENFDNEKNDYEKYVPRTTESGAKLTHDLLILDNYYYIASAMASSINIFDIDTFVKKSFAIANPIYDKNARKSSIPLIEDYVKIGNKKVKDLLADISDVFGGEGKGHIEDVIQYRYGVPEEETGTVTINELREKNYNFEQFVADFSLELHDQNSIKLPYIPRMQLKENNGKEWANLNGTIYTRFLINTLSGTLKANNTYSSQLQKYFEYIYDALEESILTEFFNGKAENANTYLIGKKDEFENSKYTYELDENYRKSISTQLDSIYNGITRCNSEVYVGNDASLARRGLVLLNEEDTSNIFQDDTSNYRLFNKVCIGYPTVDDIVSLRTPVGGWKVLVGTNWESINELSNNIDAAKEIARFVQNDFPTMYSQFAEDLFIETDSIIMYQSIAALQKIYEVVNDIKITSNSLYEPIKNWLKNECLIVKAPVYGDYVEELNFMQDLTPDSNVVFKNQRIKQTSIPFNRYQDSKYEIPFVEKTAPMLNKSAIGKKGFGLYASDAIAGVGEYPGNNSEIRAGKTPDSEKVTVQDRFTSPAFLYDFDKGDQDSTFDTTDDRVKTLDDSPQRVLPPSGKVTVEGPIASPTIDELWTFLKYLSESDGRNKNTDTLDSRIPSFYGLLKSDISDFIIGKTGHESGSKTRNRVNPLQRAIDKTTEVIDIIDWEVVTDSSLKPAFDPGTENSCHEFRFGGYNITEHIDKIYDYKIEAFDRRTFIEKGDLLNTFTIHDGSVYEFDTEAEFVKNEDPYNHPKGYLEKLYNDAIVNFLNGYKETVEYDLLTADIFEQGIELVPAFSVENDTKITSGKIYDPLKKVNFNSSEDSSDSGSNDFTDSGDSTSSNDSGSGSDDDSNTEDNGVKEIATQRWEAYKLLSRILDYKHYVNDKKGAEHPLHNHYKNYLEHPKNLKEIERDLETLRQNLQTSIEYLITTQAEKGFADRNVNRGTLHSLHRNSYEFVSTLIPLEDVNNTTRGENGFVNTKPLTDSLNDINDVAQNDAILSVSAFDKKVIYDDGRNYLPNNDTEAKWGDNWDNPDRRFESRYFHDNYDSRVVDLSGPRINTRDIHTMYRPNETLLSEVYLSADGTWRSVHEHPVIAVLDCEE